MNYVPTFFLHCFLKYYIELIFDIPKLVKDF